MDEQWFVLDVPVESRDKLGTPFLRGVRHVVFCEIADAADAYNWAVNKYGPEDLKDWNNVNLISLIYTNTDQFRTISDIMTAFIKKKIGPSDLKEVVKQDRYANRL